MSRLAFALLVSLAACVRTPATVEQPPELPTEAEPVRVTSPVLPAVPPIEPDTPPRLAPLSSFAGSAIASETREGGLEVLDYAAGEGLAAELGDYVEVHYILTVDGTEVDNSHAQDKGLALVLGESTMISGFTAGLVGVKRGMLRTIIVPPELGYRDRALVNIPANSTLQFHVQVMTVSDW